MHERNDDNDDMVVIPFIPTQVDIADVGRTNGRLIPQEQVADVKMRIAKIKSADGRYSKKELNTPYSVTKINDQYFAIYKGEQHGKLLGKGAFGSVKLVQNIETGTWAVIKTIRKKLDSDQESHDRSISREKESLQKAEHFIGHVQRKSKKKDVMQDEIIMILAPGMTVSNIIKHHNMPAVKWLDLAIGMMQSAKKMHRNGLIHRDIKPANMLAETTTNTVKLVDFGLARMMDPETKSYLGSRAGTAAYMAPEIKFEGKKARDYNEATEVYALGITLIRIFKLEQVSDYVEKTLASAQQIHNQKLLDKLCLLAASMVHKNPSKRPSLEEVIEVLSDLRNNELDLVSKINSLVYLNVNEYFKLNDIQKESLFNALKSVDEVQLCHPYNPWAPEVLMIIRHELELHGISVAPHGITLRNTDDTQKTVDRLKEITAQRGAKKNVIYSSYFLNLSADMDAECDYQFRRSIDSLEISDTHKHIAITNIERQISRIDAKNPRDRRLQFLREFKHGLENNLTRTYRQLFDELTRLQENMSIYETTSPARSLARKLGFTSTATKKVGETSQSILNDAHRGKWTGNK